MPVPNVQPVQPAQALSELLGRAVVRLYGAEKGGVDPMVRRSKHGDLQANLAMGLGKRLGKPPRKIAEEVSGGLEENDVVERIDVAGPGFLNVTLRTAWLERAAGDAFASPRLAVPLAQATDTVVLDYSAPNVAKEMHVGHLRSTVIGDALARVLEFRGHAVLRQNHVGDWGTPFGMLIEHLGELGEEAAARQVSLGELGAFYKAAREKFDGDPAFAERSRRRVVLLQAGDPATVASWRKLVDLSRTYFEDVYARLDVTLAAEHVRGESFYDPLLAPLADELLASGQAVVNDGALCLFPAGFTNKEGAPLPLIVRKADGGFGYAATDLAAIRHRAGVLGATRILYVVGAPQEQHLAMVFAAARALGWLPAGVRVEHVAFGSVLGTDKRMFRSRSGDTVRLVDLVDEATDRARAVVAEKAPDLDPATRDEVARAVGVGSIKYADLSSDRVKDYVFDLDRMVSFDGNTAGYLQYAHARVRSIFRRAGDGEASGPIAPGPIAIEDPAERALVLDLLDLGPTVAAVEGTLEPHRLAGYLYGLAGSFTTFYERCPILKAEPRVRASRLALADLTARTLATGLGLLGIAAPDRM